MSTDQTRQTGRFDRRTLKPVVKLLLVFAGLLVLWGMFTSMPGIERVIPRTPVTFGATVGAIFALTIVAVLAYAAMKAETLITTSLHGPADLVGDAATIVKHVLLFVAVVVAHGGLEPLFATFLEGPQLMWLYDVAFLVLAAIPVAIVAITMFRDLDTASERITERVSGSGDGSSGTTGDASPTARDSGHTERDSGHAARDPGTTPDETGRTTEGSGRDTDDASTN